VTKDRKPATTETVRVPIPLARKLRDLAHHERVPVAKLVAEMFGDAIAARYAKLPRSARSR
jgi:hypothetical protein